MENEKIIREVEEKWDSLYRHAVWDGLSDGEAMRQFDLYIQGLSLPYRFNDKFPQIKRSQGE